MVVTLAAVLMTLGASRVAAADTLTLMWDPSPDPTVTGYVVYIGTQPGIYTQSVNVVSASFTFSTAVPGQLYCFAVSALAGIIEGPKSAEACGYSDRRPTLTNPGAQSSTAGQSDSLQLVGSDPDGLAVTYSATGLPPGLTLGTSTGFISGTPTTSGNHSVTATVSDGVLTASQTFSWNVAGGDTTAPTISITTPTSSTTYATSSATLNLAGTAADAVGVTQVSWVNDRGGSGTATGTTSWSVNGITLQSGANDITVTARDAANNTRTDSLTVTYTPSDATAPVGHDYGPDHVRDLHDGLGITDRKRHGERCGRCDAGQLVQQPRRQRQRDGHDHLERKRHHAARWNQRHHDDRA